MALMDVSRTLEFNLGRYEQVKFTVTIKDIPLDTDAKLVSETLDDKMAPEIARAAFATVHPESDNVTSVYSWHQIVEEGMDA